jgi:hypothetical protein
VCYEVNKTVADQLTPCRVFSRLDGPGDAYRYGDTNAIAGVLGFPPLLVRAPLRSRQLWVVNSALPRSLTELLGVSAAPLSLVSGAVWASPFKALLLTFQAVRIKAVKREASVTKDLRGGGLLSGAPGTYFGWRLWALCWVSAPLLSLAPHTGSVNGALFFLCPFHWGKL